VCLAHGSRPLLGKPIDLCFRHEGAPTDPDEFDLPGGGERVQMTPGYLQRVAGVIDAARAPVIRRRPGRAVRS
jgi:hypothetical protein